MDHDQRFKTLIREFFVEFLLLFFAEWASRLDLSSVEWLDKEMFPDPPEGARHTLDLVARVPVAATTGQPPGLSLLLVHIEIESPDRTTELKPRLPYYYHHLRDKNEQPVLPIVLYLKVGLDGIGTDFVVEETLSFEVNRFRYLYVGLPALDGIEYFQSENWLGVALSALMKIPRERVAWLGAEALRRLTVAPLSDQQRFPLGECIQAYLPLDEQQKQDLQGLLQTESYVEVRAMNKTVYEEGLERGMVKGRIRLVEELIADRFGLVSAELRRHLEQLPVEELRRLALKIGTASSLAELGLPASMPEG